MVNLVDEQHLQTFLSKMVSMPDSEWTRLRASLKYRDFPPGDYFVRDGDNAQDIGFVVKGLLRKFYQTEDGREYIKDFSPEFRLVTAYSSLLQNKPSKLNIQAIEPTKLMVIPYQQFTSWYSVHPVWQELGRKIAEAIFIEREQREWQFLLFPAKDRYELFAEKNPDLLSRIPQYDIASYLGISPISLSRLIGKKRNASLRAKSL